MSTLYYVYGVIQKEHVPKFKQSVHTDIIGAVYEEVPASEFSQTALETNLKDVGWVSEKVVWHQQLVAGTQQLCAVVPLKFGSVFTSKWLVQKSLLGEQAHNFIDKLKRIEGKEEWGIKMMSDQEKFSLAVGHINPDLKALNEGSKEASAGTSFLMKKKKEALQKTIEKQEINLLRHRLYDKVKEISSEIVEAPLQENNQSNGLTNTLNLAVLTSKNDTQELLSAIEEEQSHMSNFGVSIDVTGPWPPYHFV